MKTVLCFGDSLTYGARPDSLLRHALKDRWPSALGAELEEEVQVIAEGLNGRFTAFDGPLGMCDRNGARVLPTLLHSHAPLDLVILMLGTNDILNAEVSPYLSAVGMERLVEMVRNHPYPGGGGVPDVLIVSPPRACLCDDTRITQEFVAKIDELPSHHETTAARLHCAWFDVGAAAAPSPIDGVHLDAANTRAIGVALAPMVTEILRGRHGQSTV